MSWWSDLVEVLNPLAGAEASTAQSASNLPKDAAVLAGIWTNLRDYKMWRSLGWLFLGTIVLLLGVSLWIGFSAARQSPVGIVARELG